ncbi:follicle-stimulating hormone receptor-like [Diadema antillarum]|uniref:follicle-stimulating hormone receptor-like n=1 Tax=Diadema antillarum TaxID=105358 RepID=UPI003A8B5150
MSEVPGIIVVAVSFVAVIEVIEQSGLRRLSGEDLANFTNLQAIELVNLPLQMPLPDLFRDLPRLQEMDLSSNHIRYIRKNCFQGLRINKLSLAHNPLTTLAENAFAGFEGLTDLSLEQTLIDHLPTAGLKYLLELNLEKTPSLKKFPPIFRFERLKEAKLTYFSHCCAFTYKTKLNYGNPAKTDLSSRVEEKPCPSTTMSTVTSQNRESVNFNIPIMTGTNTIPRGSDSDDYIPSIFAPSSKQLKESHQLNFQNSMPFDPSEVTNGSIEISPSRANPTYEDNSFNSEVIDPNTSHSHNGSSCMGEVVKYEYSSVNCTPKPNAFHPCSDVMGYVFLRVMVWIVSGTALIGNFIVLLVLASQRHKMTVPKFLMCNLSLADLWMGVYLLMVASVDIHTAGEYFNYSLQWQYGAGCSVAGFISMLSSELSVFSLTVITIERWYTIIYAIDLNKRIRLRLAARIMIAGWLFAILVAVLPLFNVGNYGITSMCLPFYVESKDGTATITYVAIVLFVNTIAFAVICLCYIKMYLTVRNPHTVMQRKDSKVAKRMAVLVFTDFACWAPMALFGLSMVFGHHILTTNQTKIFIVLFYPINSCANPFLYAIFTKAFRRDLYLLLAKHGMCEKQAMKYHPTATSGQRSVSQINSTAHDKNKQCHRDSLGSVLTGITSDNMPSVANCDRDQAVNSNSSPNHVSTANANVFPMVPLNDDDTRDSEMARFTADDSKSNCQSSSASDKHQSYVKRVSVTVQVSVDGLETVPEEADQNDNYDGEYEGQVSFYPPEFDSNVGADMVGPDYHKEKQYLLPQVVESYHQVDDDATHCDEGSDMNRNNCRLSLAPHRDDHNHVDNDAFRKNSRADSGIQSVNTTPTEKDNTQKSLEIHMMPCSADHETIL